MSPAVAEDCNNNNSSTIEMDNTLGKENLSLLFDFDDLFTKYLSLVLFHFYKFTSTNFNPCVSFKLG